MKSIITILLGLFICLPVMGADKELPKDFKSLKVLAEKGDARAQYMLGQAYYWGNKGVERAPKEYLKWYLKTAKQGHGEGQYSIGRLYYLGKGVLKDEKEAMKWSRKGAEQGHSGAQLNLGFMYQRGQAVLEDFVTAYAWFNIAASNKERLKFYKLLHAKEMTPDKIAKAEVLAKEMVKKNPKLINKP